VFPVDVVMAFMRPRSLGDLVAMNDRVAQLAEAREPPFVVCELNWALPKHRLASRFRGVVFPEASAECAYELLGFVARAVSASKADLPAPTRTSGVTDSELLNATTYHSSARSSRRDSVSLPEIAVALASASSWSKFPKNGRGSSTGGSTFGSGSCGSAVRQARVSANTPVSRTYELPPSIGCPYTSAFSEVRTA
jgi:hypothetical protein